MRNRKPAREWTPPTATVPDWFYERNTVLNDSRQASEIQVPQQVGVDRASSEAEEVVSKEMAQGGDGGDDSGPSKPSDSEHRYMLSHAVWEELYASVKAGLRLPPAKYADEPSAMKSHLVLQYPGDDGILFLDAVVRKLAHSLGANLVTLNAQDIAQLCSEQDIADSGMTSNVRSLGYEVYRPTNTASWQDFDDSASEGDGEESDMADRSSRPDLSAPRFITIESTRDLSDIPMTNWLGLKSLVASLNGSAADASSGSAFKGVAVTR